MILSLFHFLGLWQCPRFLNNLSLPTSIPLNLNACIFSRFFKNCPYLHRSTACRWLLCTPFPPSQEEWVFSVSPEIADTTRHARACREQHSLCSLVGTLPSASKYMGPLSRAFRPRVTVFSHLSSIGEHWQCPLLSLWKVLCPLLSLWKVLKARNGLAGPVHRGYWSKSSHAATLTTPARISIDALVPDTPRIPSKVLWFESPSLAAL